MRTYWSQIPILRIAIALISGIGLAMVINQEQLQVVCVWFFAVLLVVSLVSAITFNHLKNIAVAYRYKSFSGVAVTVAIFASGFLLTAFQFQKNYAADFSHYSDSEKQLLVKVDQPPVLRDKVVMVTGEVQEVHSKKEIICTTGRLQMSITKDSLSQHLQYGDVIMIQAKIDSVQEPMNPDEFNYKRYLCFQNIFYKTYLNPGAWKLVTQNRGNLLLTGIFHLRNNLLRVIEKYVHDKNDFGVASAIMLGYNDYINGDIRRAYSSSGTLHVLSVSGLHVGIIFLMLNFLLQWMNTRGRKAEISKAVIIISFIWFYACLTGMSPPVLRSAFMFTLIQLGKALIRNVNMYNIVAGSAVLMLLYNPFVLADVGFQLSYVAVIGIVYLEPKISGLIKFEIPERRSAIIPDFTAKLIAFFRYDLKWLGMFSTDWLWRLISVSIAAQIATLPLCLMYFYQFPNLFIISNLIVIPMSNFVLFSGTALLAFSHIPYLNDFMGWIFSHLLMLLDKYIFWVDTLPFALTRGVYLSAIEMTMLYGFIILLCWFSEEKKPRVLIASLIVFVGLCSFRSYHVCDNKQRKQIVVYDIPKQKAIAFISAKKVLYDFDTDLWNNSQEMAFSVWHYWAECGIREEIPLENLKQNVWPLSFGKLVLFEGRKILIVNSAIGANNSQDNPRLKADLVIISGNPKIQIYQLQKLCDFEELVFDSSNKYFSMRKWKEECDAAKIRCWDTKLSGVYRENIN